VGGPTVRKGNTRKEALIPKALAHSAPPVQHVTDTQRHRTGATFFSRLKGTLEKGLYPQHFLYFLPLPQGQGSLRLILPAFMAAT
jgi:hypothetical protein